MVVVLQKGSGSNMNPNNSRPHWSILHPWRTRAMLLWYIFQRWGWSFQLIGAMITAVNRYLDHNYTKEAVESLPYQNVHVVCGHQLVSGTVSEEPSCSAVKWITKMIDDQDLVSAVTTECMEVIMTTLNSYNGQPHPLYANHFHWPIPFRSDIIIYSHCGTEWLACELVLPAAWIRAALFNLWKTISLALFNLQ